MANPTPEEVDAYLQATLLEPDEVLETITRRGRKAGLPDHSVSPLQGQFLTMLTMVSKAKRVLEIGSLAGYSTMCFARGIPKDGVVVTLENNPVALETTRKAFKQFRYWRNVQIFDKDAKASLDYMIDVGFAPFDIIFIDADKQSNPIYLEAALKLSKPGTLIIGDNVIREGAVADANSTDPKVVGIRTFLQATGQNRNLLATAFQTVGAKGHDGFSVALVIEPED